jgi:hypothetical protein
MQTRSIESEKLLKSEETPDSSLLKRLRNMKQQSDKDYQSLIKTMTRRESQINFNALRTEKLVDNEIGTIGHFFQSSRRKIGRPSTISNHYFFNKRRNTIKEANVNIQVKEIELKSGKGLQKDKKHFEST